MHFIQIIQSCTAEKQHNILSSMKFQNLISRIPFSLMSFLPTAILKTVSLGIILVLLIWRIIAEIQWEKDPISKCYTDPQAPIVTLFTTFKASASLEDIHRQMLFSLAKLQPKVKLVLFLSEYAENGDLLEEAQDKGWLIQRAVSNNGIPILRRMFLKAQDLHPLTPFYAYGNADIVFTEDLVESLTDLYRYCHLFDQQLIIGRRRNYVLQGERPLQNKSWIHEAVQLDLFNGYAQDYFITSKGGYPWEEIPDFVVGRAGFDNWLMVNAILNNIPVIDASYAITAIHLSNAEDQYRGHVMHAHHDRAVNYILAGMHFDYTLAAMRCSHMILERNKGRTVLKHRVPNTCTLQYFKNKRNPYYFKKKINLDDGR